MNFEEHALRFSCRDSALYGIVSAPERPSSRGVLIVVGGPQYRVGSHRQFTLLARSLASHAVPAMRFDYRGMGDSEGGSRTFEDVGDDLHYAIDQFFERVPAMTEVVIWGLCDAASAALFYAHTDARVTGLVLLNPWARSEDGIARTYLKHYYVARLLERDFWEKLVSGRFDFVSAGRSFLSLLGNAFPGKKQAAQTSGESQNGTGLHERMFVGLSRFKGKVLLILSGDDLTAREFSDLAGVSRKWRSLLKSQRVTRLDLAEANHTFSRRVWRDKVSAWTRDWVISW